MCKAITRGAWSIGNGQLHDAMSPSREVCKTLNCMDDPMKILIVRNNENELGRHTDGTDIDSKQCRRESENAGQREF